MRLSQLPGYENHQYPSWPPNHSPLIDQATPILKQISEQDILLVHPYESFDPVIRMLEEAAHDPDVLAIKQVLYRTASDSRIISALVHAAESGKQVTVLVELKARFDEARNLQRAEILRQAGVQIVYGVRDLKTHAKVTLVARNEEGRLRRYVHLGTGNYNETTAQLYTDVSYLTCRADYVADASHFFNAVTGRSRLMRLKKIYTAPTHLKNRILQLIDSEAARARQGEMALIMAKCNSLQDPEVIEALYRASSAGVEIKLNIRGVCCLQRSNKRQAKNIEVVSIVDRYLEHARVFYFHQGGDPEVYFSSADWMTRNLEKRVELLVPVEDPQSKKRLIEILRAAFRDNTNAFELLKDGTSRRLEKTKGEKRFRSQEHLYKAAQKASKAFQRERSTTFTPHRPPGK
jgi:polyphosphate kinase